MQEVNYIIFLGFWAVLVQTSVGSTFIVNIVISFDTHNIYDVMIGNEQLHIYLKVYGLQLKSQSLATSSEP